MYETCSIHHLSKYSIKYNENWKRCPLRIVLHFTFLIVCWALRFLKPHYTALYCIKTDIYFIYCIYMYLVDWLNVVTWRRTKDRWHYSWCAQAHTSKQRKREFKRAKRKEQDKIKNAQRTKQKALNRLQCIKCTLHIYLVNLFLISKNEKRRSVFSVQCLWATSKPNSKHICTIHIWTRLE